jgi:4-amino-4-deoxy-L-arabinose transferase-like glycosyltransferase
LKKFHSNNNPARINSSVKTSFIKNPFLWLTIGICSLLLIPALFMNGMFTDGVLYAAVSKNYTAGTGTFWEPVFSASSVSAFHEQPPLLFFLQGIFFKLLGNGIYTERIYCLLAAIINSFLIYRCWKICIPSSRISWLPVLFWFISPVIFYAFINNLEECTMSIFVLAAMIHLLQTLHNQRDKTFHLLIASGFILLAGLTKGPQGMFLLSAPFAWWICDRSKSFLTMIRHSFLLATVPGLFMLYALFTPQVYDSMEAYFHARFVLTFNHVRDTAGRFHILYELLLDSLDMLCIMAIVLFSTRKRIKILKGWEENKKLILFFLLIAATGILPLMVTLEQRGFYLVTPLPFLVIAAALFVEPQFRLIQENLLSRKKFALSIGFSGMLLTVLAIIVAVVLAGTPKRDADKLTDLSLIAAKTGEHKIILTNKKVYTNWGMGTYAMRFYDLAFTENAAIAGPWLVLEKTDSAPGGYTSVVLPTKLYNLFRKQP